MRFESKSVWLFCFFAVIFLLCSISYAQDSETWICPECGAEMNTAFCTQCGAKRPDEIKCQSCGEVYPLDTDALFCGKCGAKLDKGSPSEKKESLNTSDAFGVWEIKNYVDEFSRQTSSKYVRNAKLIKGKFSNSATNNSSLSVRLLVDNSDISIMLYEYDNHQVKTYSSSGDKYSVMVLAGNGKKYGMNGTMYSDRINISYADKEKLLSVLAEGGEISFSITEKNHSINHYVFTIENATGFIEAYKELTGNLLIPITKMEESAASAKEEKKAEEKAKYSEIYSYARALAELLEHNNKYFGFARSKSTYVNKKFYMVDGSLIDTLELFEYFFNNKTAVQEILVAHEYEKDYEQIASEIKEVLKKIDSLDLDKGDRAYFDDKYKHLPK